MTFTKTQQTEKDEARTQLLKWLKPGDTIYTVLRHRSRSGMQRSIGVVLLTTNDNDEPVDLHPNYSVSKILGRRQSKDDGVICNGTGMDMGFELVYSVSRMLFPEGFECLGERCPSNDHSNGDRNRTPHHHASGGYALRHRWL